MSEGSQQQLEGMPVEPDWCEECSRPIPQPPHDICECGERLTVYRHYHLNARRYGYCAAAYREMGNGACYWNESESRWKHSANERLTGRTFDCERCGVACVVRNGRYRGSCCEFCRKLWLGGGRDRSEVDFVRCAYGPCGELFCRGPRDRRGDRKSKRYCSLDCANAESQRLRRERKKRQRQSGVTPAKRRKGKRRQTFVEREAFNQAYKCWHCGGLMRLGGDPLSPLYATEEHIVQLGGGHRGTDDDDNKVVAHRKCNTRRGVTGPIQLGLDKPGVSGI